MSSDERPTRVGCDVFESRPVAAGELQVQEVGQPPPEPPPRAEWVDAVVGVPAREEPCRHDSAWVSVDERLPDEGVNVLVYCDPPEALVASRRRGRWEWTSFIIHPTHWMPLPDAPGGGS